ncbi:MAG TPA: enoyl-CoA hydratase/isomerase family protein [Xanthobacteraceae bacterium]|jgi:enoyl-CoA hydratase|nr:enoyl-CoA hydratase/isomerase family protein [Xanthobacteraceae bacterium]
MPNEPEILVERRGTAGVITLNRPAALNAVTRGMVGTLREALTRWRDDGAVTRIIITAAGGRAFSAGGDLRQIYEAGRAGRQEESIAFWREEYALNTLIKRYPKPCVALIDGIVMGGGVGISVHGSHRLAGDRFQFAMPEVGIGFFPDVGATWFLPRLPGAIGTYLALTGERLKAADAVAVGIATHRVASARFSELVEALCGAAPVDAILAAFAEPAEPSPSPQSKSAVADFDCSIDAHRTAIDRIFAAGSVEEILALLDAEAATASCDARWAGEVAATIRAKAPLSLKIALEQMRRGSKWSFEECMRAEFRVVSRVAYGHDFYEGIRAVIIDKDNRPQWRPATLAEVTAETVERHFAPLESELVLP